MSWFISHENTTRNDDDEELVFAVLSRLVGGEFEALVAGKDRDDSAVARSQTRSSTSLVVAPALTNTGRNHDVYIIHAYGRTVAEAFL